MKKTVKIIVGLFLFLAVLGLGLSFIQGQGKIADAGVEVYDLGREKMILGAAGATSVGDYPDPLPDDAYDREIVLAYTCIGTEVLFNKVLPSFAQYWEDQTGEKVKFTTGWNSVGRDTVATYVYDKPVEVLILSSMNNAQIRGYSKTKWQNTKNNGIVYSYPWVFVVRNGNPFDIKTYEDLLKPEVRVARIDPLGTHGGMWTVFGLYGNALRKSEKEHGVQDESSAEEFLSQIEQKSVFGPTGGGTAALLARNEADVLITIEPMALRAVQRNPSFEIIVPPSTMVTDLAVYTMKKNIPNRDKDLIDAFVDFLFTEQVQDSFAEGGYRSSDVDVLSKHKKYLPLEDPLHMDYLGEPTQAKKTIFLDKWINVRNKTKPNWEKIKVKKLPNEPVSVETGLPVNKNIAAETETNQEDQTVEE